MCVPPAQLDSHLVGISLQTQVFYKGVGQPLTSEPDPFRFKPLFYSPYLYDFGQKILKQGAAKRRAPRRDL